MDEHPRIEPQRQYIRARAEDLLRRTESMTDEELRWTVRLFADCLDPTERDELLRGYNEYLHIEDVQRFVSGFIPRYTERALADLEAKRLTDGSRPDELTDEELQSMSLAEKWELLERHPAGLTGYKLRRELARLFMCGNYDLYHDSSLSESAVEFPIYHQVQERLMALQEDLVLKLAAKVQEMTAGLDCLPPQEAEGVLARIRSVIGEAIDVHQPLESLVAGRMAKLPLVAEPTTAELAAYVKEAIGTMTPEELKRSLFVLLDLMTLEELRRDLSPLQGRYPSVHDIPAEILVGLVPTLAAKLGDRHLCDFADRYREGRMLAMPPVGDEVWSRLPMDDRLKLLEQDNDRMDLAQISRHLAKIFLSPEYQRLFDPEAQLGTLESQGYQQLVGKLLLELGRPEEGRRLRALNRVISRMMLEAEATLEADREERLLQIRKVIGTALDLPDEQIFAGRKGREP
ncbi:MAG: hypothetical protein HY278_08740 [candidate division NC10 bacterium]|nr:hypothetical protein [candidate division NC10 bacterium]